MSLEGIGKLVIGGALVLLVLGGIFLLLSRLGIDRPAVDEGGSVAVAELALWKGSAEQIDRWARMQQEETRAIVERHAGRAFWLANREKGEAVTLTIHEGHEAAKATY